MRIPMAFTKRVVVIGGGFGGLSVIKSLRKSGFQIVLIDINNCHQFQPLLYQVATSSLEPTAISFPLRRILRGYKDLYFLMAKATGVDSVSGVVHTSDGDISYDYLVVSAGADTNFFSMENIRLNSLPLKNVNEALSLRNRIYRTMEFADRCSDDKRRQAYLNFVIVGGGATGVELAGAVAELRNKVLPKDYPGIDFAKMNIYLLNASNRLLETFSPLSSERTLRDLQKLGVNVMLNAKVSDYLNEVVVYNNNQQIEAFNLVWASGIVANAIQGLETTGRGRRIVIDNYCRVQGYENIFAIGDIAINNDKPLPQVAQVAIQQGRNAGLNIVNVNQGIALKEFRYFDKGSMATIGRNRAVAEVGKFRKGGFVAWVMWLFVHLYFIIGVRNKLHVLWDWSWSYVTRDQPLRSIIEADKK